MFSNTKCLLQISLKVNEFFRNKIGGHYSENCSLYCYAECHYAAWRYEEYHFAACCYVECHYAGCHYAEFHYAEWHYSE
jgi:hypothetical protein